MPWPPTLPPTGRADSTPQLVNHPSDHNLIAAALDEIVTRMSSGFRITRPQTGLSVVNAADQTILPGTEIYANNWSQSGLGYQFNGAERTGFVIVAGARWNVNATGHRAVRILLDGSEVVSQIVQANNAGETKLQTVFVGAIIPGTIVTMQVWQNSGGSLDLLGGSGTFMSAAPGYSE